MLTRLFVVGLFVSGCSSSNHFFYADGGVDGAVRPDAQTDTASEESDTATVDTMPQDTGSTVVDTGPPPPLTCALPLHPYFSCSPPTPKAGSTVCTDAAINAIVAGCFGTSATSASCSSAQSTYGSCATCMLSTWLYNDRFIDVGACIQKIDPTSTCGTTWRCNIDCAEEVCGDCDHTPGSGKTSTRSEADDCWADAQSKGTSTKPKGACYDIATKDYAACAADDRFTVCFARTTADITYFYRGACRDGGSWANAYSP